MGCNGCPEKSGNNLNVDRRGNITKDKAELEDRPENKYKPKQLPNELKTLTYVQYAKEKAQAREYGKQLGNDAVKTFSIDHKRIQIKELIDVVNHEDGGPLGPTQALQALYDLSSIEDYTDVFSEFPGLKQRVEELYQKLIKNNKIIVEWSP